MTDREDSEIGCVIAPTAQKLFGLVWGDEGWRWNGRGATTHSISGILLEREPEHGDLFHRDGVEQRVYHFLRKPGFGPFVHRDDLRNKTKEILESGRAFFRSEFSRISPP